MSNIAALPATSPVPNLPTDPPELSPEQLFDRAAAITGCQYRGDPLAQGASPEEVVMGAIASFGDDPNISDHERGVLLAQIVDMKSDGFISDKEANWFANEVEGLRVGLIDYQP
jgi:hypothetical protein